MPHELRTALNDVATLATSAVEDAVAALPRVGAPIPYRVAATELVVPIVEAYGDVAATVAADWYDETRAAQRVTGGYRARLAPPIETGRIEGMVRWAVSPLFEDFIDWDAALHWLLLGSERQVRNAGRDTVITNSLDDPQATGWQRVTSGGCGFCQMLAGRGAVYRSERTASFGAHDNCRCSVAVAWDGRPRPVRAYEVSERDISDADRARAREWMRAHGYVD